MCKTDDGKQNNSIQAYICMKMHQRQWDLNVHLVGLYDGLGCEYDGDVGLS